MPWMDSSSRGQEQRHPEGAVWEAASRACCSPYGAPRGLWGGEMKLGHGGSENPVLCPFGSWNLDLEVRDLKRWILSSFFHWDDWIHRRKWRRKALGSRGWGRGAH